METPFPGMDPYLEHPVLWQSVHSRLIVALASQPQPGRASGPGTSHPWKSGFSSRVSTRSGSPYVWVQKTSLSDRVATPIGRDRDRPTPLVVEVQQLEIHQRLHRDPGYCYHDFGVVTVIELVSPSNKAAGPGRDSYVNKQRQIQRRANAIWSRSICYAACMHVMSIPESHLATAKPYDYLACVNRWPVRSRFELYPCRWRERLPTIGIPLAEPDTDVPLGDPNARWNMSISTFATTCSACVTMSLASPFFRPTTRSGPPNGGRPIARPIRSSSRTPTAAEFARNSGEAPGLGAPSARRQYWSEETTSPAEVISAFQTSGLIVFLMNRTEPSPNAALKPPGCGEPAPKNGASPPGRSSGRRAWSRGPRPWTRGPGSCSTSHR